MPEVGKQGVGRPRNHGLDHLIWTATLELLAESGEAAAALDDVAARAGVGKSTTYRRWTSKPGLILDALTAHLPIELPATDHGSLAADARALLADLVVLLGTQHPRAARPLLTQLSTWSELAEACRHGVLDPWTTALRCLATRAHTRGQAEGSAPLQLAIEAAAAHICLQWLMDPGSLIDDPARGGHVEDLVGTLIGSRPRR